MKKYLPQNIILVLLTFILVSIGLNGQENPTIRTSHIVTKTEVLNYFEVMDEGLCDGKVSLSVDALDLLGNICLYGQSVESQLGGEDINLTGYVSLSGKQKVSSFHLAENAKLELKNELVILSQGDVIIDGDIFGKTLRDNSSGQHLLIHSGGNIIIRGGIHLSDGGDAGQSLAITEQTSKLNLSMMVSALVPDILASRTLHLNGGLGGSIVLVANEIIIEGHMAPGDGGIGLHGGKSGDGGSITMIGEHIYHKSDIKAGNGGHGRHGVNGGHGGDAQSFLSSSTIHVGQANSSAMIGGDGGSAIVFLTDGINGTNNSGAGTQTGDGGAGGNGTGGDGTSGGAGAGGIGGSGANGTGTNGSVVLPVELFILKLDRKEPK